MAKVIIESAINGVALTKSLNPHVAYDSVEIADDAIATRKAGAALVHFHVRDGETGKFVFEHNAKYTDVYRRTRSECDVLLWPGADIMSMTKGERASMPDLLFCDPGSLNLVSYDPAKKKIRNESAVYRNTYEDTRRTLTKLQELRLRPTINMFEPGFVRATRVFLDEGLLSEPLMVKFYFGGPELPFGMPPSLRSLEAYLEMLKDVRVNWFAATLGGDNLPMIPLIVSLGGHVRVGLEDYHYAREGKLSNPQIAEQAASAIRAMGHEVATPDDARRILEL
jgi:3-keto-5-aminohexanoate cleavage enzyme